MTSIFETVYDILREATDGIKQPLKTAAELKDRIDSGYYSADITRTIQRPRYDALMGEIHADINTALDKAHAAIDEHIKALKREDELDPSALTDDIKLLQGGIKLTEGDINAMLRRCNGNKTMTQLVVRYADEHKILPKGVVYNGNGRAINDANGLHSVVEYYRRWADQPNNSEMLDKFFMVKR